jgi:hypothetical protein
MEGERLEPGSPARSHVWSAVRDPVIPILFLAGLFDGISDNWVHAALLWFVAGLLGWEALHGRALDEPAGRIAPRRPFADRSPVARRGWTSLALFGAVSYVWLGGSFGRYSWPMTAAIVLPAAAVLAIGWPRPEAGASPPEPTWPVGAVAWGAVFLSACLLELTSLLLQPSFRTDSYAHPTISFLMDPLLASHLGRAIGLFAWLALGWLLLLAFAGPGPGA